MEKSDQSNIVMKATVCLYTSDLSGPSFSKLSVNIVLEIWAT